MLNAIGATYLTDARELQRAAVVHQLLAVVDDRAGLLEKLLDARQPAARDRLVRRRDHPHQPRLVVQRLQHRHRGHRGAVRVGDDALRPVARVAFEVHLADDQRHVGVLAEGRRVVDDDGARSGEPRSLHTRHRRARGEQCDVKTARVGGLGVLDLDLLAAEFELAALRARGREEPHRRRREVALVEQRAHHLADLSGRADYTDVDHLSSCPRRFARLGTNVLSLRTPLPLRRRRGRTPRATPIRPCPVRCP